MQPQLTMKEKDPILSMFEENIDTLVNINEFLTQYVVAIRK